MDNTMNNTAEGEGTEVLEQFQVVLKLAFCPRHETPSKSGVNTDGTMITDASQNACSFR
jgi:hypothetical protein